MSSVKIRSSRFVSPEVQAAPHSSSTCCSGATSAARGVEELGNKARSTKAKKYRRILPSRLSAIDRQPDQYSAPTALRLLRRSQDSADPALARGSRWWTQISTANFCGDA